MYSFQFYSFYSQLLPAELQLLPSCHMDGPPQFLVVLELSTLKNPPPRHVTSPIYSFYSWPLQAELQLLPSCQPLLLHMVGLPLFLMVIFELSTHKNLGNGSPLSIKKNINNNLMLFKLNYMRCRIKTRTLKVIFILLSSKGQKLASLNFLRNFRPF